MKGENIYALRAKSGLQSEVLYYDDNAVLTMQCDAQSYFKLWQGAEGKAIQASLEVVFFGFLFFNQPNQHSEGVG